MSRIIFFLLLFYGVNIFATEKDSILLVYLEKNDTIELGFNLVFENTTGDTISLYNRFEDFRLERLITSGFSAYVYHNKSLAVQIRDEPQIYYHIPDYRFAKGRFVLIPPYGRTQLSFSVLSFFSILKEMHEELGVEFWISYTYWVRNPTTQRSNQHYKMTNYLILKEEGVVYTPPLYEDQKE